MQFGNPCPFAPPPLQRPHRYYEHVRPCNPIRADCRFSRSPDWPDLGSCRLYAGCRAINEQVPFALIRARLHRPLLTSSKISTLHRSVCFRSTSQASRDGSFPPFPGPFTTTAIEPQQRRVVWTVRLHGQSGGPSSIQSGAWIVMLPTLVRHHDLSFVTHRANFCVPGPRV